MNYAVTQTEDFAKWHTGLKDLRARVAIARRIENAAHGNLGDVKSLGSGLSEMRIDVGPGYRIYFVRRGTALLLLLAGGDKNTQDRDIKAARALAQEI